MAKTTYLIPVVKEWLIESAEMNAAALADLGIEVEVRHDLGADEAIDQHNDILGQLRAEQLRLLREHTKSLMAEIGV
jgi:hypothetical protein